MNKQTEALKMAIEAMDMDNDCECGRSNEVVSALINALEACKEELKNLEKDPPISRNEQPAQEPVAFTNEDELSELKSGMTTCYMYKQAIDDNDIALYTHPCVLTHSAPSWQGLSDDEIEETAIKAFGDADFVKEVPNALKFVARAIEQALRSKNEQTN